MNTSLNDAQPENRFAENEPFPRALVRASRSVRYAATGALVLLALFLLVETISAIQGMLNYTNASLNTIMVTGEGTATAIPDTATISFGATATAADVATAQTKINTIINAALASVKANGVSADDITTDSFNISPHYTTTSCVTVPAVTEVAPAIMTSAADSASVSASGPMMPPAVSTSYAVPCEGSDSMVSGYDVSETVDVKITDLTKVSPILAGLAKANVSNLSGPNFVLGDPQAVEAQARGIAITKAEQDAQTLAAQLHVHLVKIVSYSDNGSGVSPEPMMATASAMATSDAVAPSVPVGQNTYTKDVSITYEIR